MDDPVGSQPSGNPAMRGALILAALIIVAALVYWFGLRNFCPEGPL